MSPGYFRRAAESSSCRRHSRKHARGKHDAIPADRGTMLDRPADVRQRTGTAAPHRSARPDCRRGRQTVRRGLTHALGLAHDVITVPRASNGVPAAGAGAADQQSRAHQCPDHDPGRPGGRSRVDALFSRQHETARRWPSARLSVIVPVVVRMISGGRSALTGRVGRHSTAGLAVIAAASLVPAQLDEGIGRSHPQLRRERRVVGGPV